MHWATENRTLKVVKLFINDNINAKDDRGWTPLHLAANKNKLEVAKLLISNRADINAKDDREWTPLHHAANKGNLNIVKLLVDSNGIKIDTVSGTEKNTPLHIAAKAGQLEVVKVLVNSKADVNAKNEYGKTPLHLAAENNHTAVSNFLHGRLPSTINHPGLFICTRQNII